MKRVFAVLVAAAALLLGLALPSHAGGDSTLAPGTITTKAGPCGSGYTLIGHHPVGNGMGYLDVYWSSSARRNCMATVHAGSYYGDSLYTEAAIRPAGWSWPSCPSSTGCDGGFYRYFAGPVYTPAGVDMSRRCLDIKGTVDWSSRVMARVHCG
ncbi:MAG TPA: hypothetical protein VIP77_24410 [Jiangellaceae bacterium]